MSRPLIGITSYAEDSAHWGVWDLPAALIPLAYTLGTDFKLAPRDPLETMVHWDTW